MTVHNNIDGYRFELITGPMSCGKTEELLRRLRRAKIANKKVKIFTPAIDTRSKKSHIESRTGLTQLAIVIKSPAEILSHISPEDYIIGIDELQFFDETILETVNNLLSQGKKIIASGLELDFKAEPFGYMPTLMCIADKVDKLTSICISCGSEYASRTQRLINGLPADKESPTIMIGGDESYEARCLDCYIHPNAVSLSQNLLTA